MGEYLIKEDTLGLLANTIRSKSGLTGKLNIGDMVLAIEDLQLGVDTSDATASSAEIAEGYTAYVNGVKLTGEGEILVSSGISVENFLAQNPGYFDNADTTTYTPGNNTTFNVESRFRFEINSCFKLGSAWQKYNNFEDYGIIVYKDQYGIFEDMNVTYLDLLNNPEAVIYQKKDGIIGDKIVNNSIPGFKVLTRDIWLNEGETHFYANSFIKVNGQVYIRPNSYKIANMKETAQELANKNASSNPAVSNLMTAIVNLIETYFIRFPQTTTFNLKRDPNPPIYETDIS